MSYGPRFEISAMVLAVVLAALSIVATFGSAHSGDLVFCRLVDGEMVVGYTTDCAGPPDLDVIEIEPLDRRTERVSVG